MHLLSCIAKGLPPRRLSAPKLQLPVCRLADPSTGAICLGGAVASTGSPFTRPPAFLSATLGPSGLVPWGAPGRPYLLGDGLTVSQGLRKALCARLSHPDFHPDSTVGRGPSPAHGGVRTCRPLSTLEPSEHLLSSSIVPRRTPALDQGLAFQVPCCPRSRQEPGGSPLPALARSVAVTECLAQGGHCIHSILVKTILENLLQVAFLAHTQRACPLHPGLQMKLP